GKKAAEALKSPPQKPKALLVEAVRDLLSEDNISRRKMGFTLPFERWMRNELLDEMVSVLDSDGVAAAGLDRAEVRGVWDAFQNSRPGMNWSRPWALYTLIRWARENDIVWPDGNVSVAGLAYEPVLT